MRHLVTLAVVSALALSAAASAQTQRRSRGAEVAGPANEMICRRFLRTGTLADYYRVCKTRAEWDRERQGLRDLSYSGACRLESGGGYGGQNAGCFTGN